MVGTMESNRLGQFALVDRSTYVAALRSRLPPGASVPARSRLAFIPGHIAVIVVGICAIARGWVAYPLVPLVSLGIGMSYAGLTFVAHEAMHGGIVRGRRARWLVAWICFLPFTLSPRLWSAWHD